MTATCVLGIVAILAAYAVAGLLVVRYANAIYRWADGTSETHLHPDGDLYYLFWLWWLFLVVQIAAWLGRVTHSETFFAFLKKVYRP